MEDKIKEAAVEIANKISALPQGSEFKFGDYFKEYNFEDREKFELMEKTVDLCESMNISISNTQEDMTIGMPWVFVYKKMN